MLSNYLKFAIRNGRRHSVHVVVNVFGLALGIAAAFVIGLYLHQELTYDRGFEDSDRIYRVATDFLGLGGFAKSQQQLVDQLPEATAAIDLATRFDTGYRPLEVLVEDTAFKERTYMRVDSAFFDMFSFEFIEGSRVEAMHRPDEVVLSETLARTYFGDTRVVGRTLRIGKDEQVFQVSGVVKKPDFHTHLEANLWLPLPPKDPSQFEWMNMEYYNYFRVLPGYDGEAIEEGLNRLLETQMYPASGTDATFEAWVNGPQALQFWVQHFTDIYLHSEFNFEVTPGGNAAQVFILGIIGIFLLLIAGFNYVNLTTAAASARVKEIGLKRSMGVERSTLMQQFLFESVFFGVVAMVLAAGLSEVLLSVFAYITGTVLVESIVSEYAYLGALLGFSVLIGVLAGAYPAFYLSGIQPMQLLKGGEGRNDNVTLRKVLVVAQFGIAIVLITGSVVVFNQLSFMQDADKGLDAEQVLVINNVSAMDDQQQVFQEQLEALPAVVSTSIARRVPTGVAMSAGIFATPEMAEGISLERFRADEHYIETLGMRLTAGRNFTGSFATDSSAAILNESAVRALGITGDPIGQRLNQGLYVIGVVSDFHDQSLRARVEPAIILYAETGFSLVIKFNAANTASLIDNLEATWQSFEVELPMSYYFMDQNFAALVQQEETLSRAISFFTLLAVLIACLGLFGLTTYTVQRRTREFGIRKILGASVAQIIALLSADFLTLIGIAFLVATPIAYLSMRSWLDGFAYRVELGAGAFVMAGVLAVLLALCTLAFHAVRASLVNPIEAVRDV